MATAQQMKDFEGNARYIVCADPGPIKEILKQVYQFDERDVSMLNSALTEHSGQSNVQLRDKAGHLFWLKGGIDPLGIPKFSLRYQANEWPQGSGPSLRAEAAGQSYTERVQDAREKLRAVLLRQPFRTAEEFLADNRLMTLILRGNNPEGEPYVTADHSLGRHPLLLGKKYPAQPHHWTSEGFRGFLEQEGRPAHTLDDLEREHAATIRTALKRGLRIPEHVLLSAEGKIAAREAAEERVGSNHERRRQKLLEQKKECMGMLLASIAADQGHADKRSCSLLLGLAAQAAHPPAHAMRQYGLCSRGLGESVEVSHPELPFPIRITFATTEAEEHRPGAGLGHFPQERNCALIAEDAGRPFGNAYATLAYHGAEYVRMSAQDMLRDGRMTPSQAETLLGHGFTQSCMPRVFVTQNSSPAEVLPPEDDEERPEVDRPRG